MKNKIIISLIFFHFFLFISCEQPDPNYVDTTRQYLDHAIGFKHSIGVNKDNVLYAWGNNSSSQLGNLSIEENKPVKVNNDSDWKLVFANHNSSMAIKLNGSLWAWGDNEFGQLGNGTTTLVSTPTLIDAGPWKTVAMGFGFSIAIKQDGTMWSWGLNANGQLGLGNNADVLVPTQIGSLTNWNSVSAGRAHSLAINAIGELYGFGRNAEGQLGNTSTTSPTSPVLISVGPWKEAAGGREHSIAIKKNGNSNYGTLWATGRNNYGQLGVGTTINTLTFVQIDASTNWFKVEAEANQSAATKININSSNSYPLFTWGMNTNGQLGNGNINTIYVPTQVNSDVRSIKMSDRNTSIIENLNGAALFTTGENSNGQIGNGTNTSSTIFMRVWG